MSKKDNTPKQKLLQAALDHAARGWYVFPCVEKGAKAKHPYTKNGFKDASTDPKIIRQWWTKYPDALIGLACGKSRLFVVDLDEKDGKRGVTNFDKVGIDYAGALQSTTPNGGLHLVFSGSGKNTTNEELGIDTRGAGGYFIAPPSMIFDCGPYVAINDWAKQPATIPVGLIEALESLRAKPAPKSTPKPQPAPKADDVEKARQALERLNQWRCDDYQPWVDVGMTLSELGTAGLSLWDSWSRRSKKYQEGVCAKKWESFKPGQGLTLGSLIHWAEEDDPRPMEESSSIKPESKLLTRRMQTQTLARRVKGEKQNINPADFDEPYKRYWLALENSAQGKEVETLKAIASNDDLKRILETNTESAHYPSLAELENQIKDVSWYWDYRIPNGKMTVLGGESGVSKSMLAQRICYMQIHASKFPDDSSIHDPARPVLYVDCEGFASGIKSRAKAWAMDMSKFFLWSVDLDKDGFINFSNQAFRDELIERIDHCKPALVVIDSFGNATAGGQDKVEDVRELLNFLNRVAYDFNIALILVAHTRKPPAIFNGKGEINQDDIRGSGHVVAMARSVIGVWIVQTKAEPDPNGTRIMAVLKSSYGRKPKPIGYDVFSDSKSDNPVIVFSEAPKPYKEPTQAELCANWIIESLEEADEPIKPKELEALAQKVGFKRDTFYAAHRKLERERRVKDTLGNKNPENAWQLSN